MVDDEVHDDADIALFGFLKKVIEILHRPVIGVDGIVVAYVIAHIEQRALVNRRKPDDVDAKIVKVIELGDYALDVADAVAVGIAERARIDLIDDLIVERRLFAHRRILTPIADLWNICPASQIQSGFRQKAA